MTWYVVRTKTGHERDVAASIAVSHDVWLPMETRYVRARRKTGQHRKWDQPAYAGWLFAAVPVAQHGDLQKIRGYLAVLRDSASAPIPVDPRAIHQWRENLDRHNARVCRSYEVLLQGGRAKAQRLVLKGFAELKQVMDGMERENG